MASRFRLSRRTFLKGLGTCVALPALEAMAPASARAAARPVQRYLFFYTPNGFHMPSWELASTTSGPLGTLSPTLASLAPYTGDITVLRGLDNRPGEDDIPGNHARATAAFLTCRHVTKSSQLEVGTSVDQLLAREIGQATRFPSLELGLEGGTGSGTCDGGYSCAYLRNISWAGPATPMAKETSPKAVFDRLFAGVDPGATTESIARRNLYRKSVLDAVRDDAGRLEARLGTADRRKLDEFLTGVRELERRIDASGGALACVPPGAPAEGVSREEQVRQMCDLMTLAFQCDVTRVITFMLANGQTNHAYDFLGVGEGHHELSHHREVASAIAHLETIDAWQVKQFAYLVERMRGAAEGAGNLLDSSLLFFSSELANGNKHVHANLPVVLAGRANGAVRPGRQVSYQGAGGEFPIGDLFLWMLQTAGVELSTFGLTKEGRPYGTRPLEGLA